MKRSELEAHLRSGLAASVLLVGCTCGSPSPPTAVGQSAAPIALPYAVVRVDFRGALTLRLSSVDRGCDRGFAPLAAESTAIADLPASYLVAGEPFGAPLELDAGTQRGMYGPSAVTLVLDTTALVPGARLRGHLTLRARDVAIDQAFDAAVCSVPDVPPLALPDATVPIAGVVHGRPVQLPFAIARVDQPEVDPRPRLSMLELMPREISCADAMDYPALMDVGVIVISGLSGAGPDALRLGSPQPADAVFVHHDWALVSAERRVLVVWRTVELSPGGHVRGELVIEGTDSDGPGPHVEGAFDAIVCPRAGS